MSLIDTVGTLAGLPAILADAFPSKVALVSGDRRVTYAEFEAQTNRVADVLRRRGIGTRDRVAMLLPDPLDAALLVFGAAKVGAVSVNINPRLAPPEIAHILGDSDARLLVADEALAPLLSTLAKTSSGAVQILRTANVPAGLPLDDWCGTASAAPVAVTSGTDDVVVQIYTSGTTGRPKGVQLPNRSFFALAQRMAAAGDPWIGWTDQSVSLLFVPLFHIGGLWWLVRGLAVGSTNVVLRAFEPAAVLRAIPEHRVTTTCMVPAMAQVLLREPGCRTADFSSLETIVYGGSPISPALLREAITVFGCEFCQIYGMTETGNMAVCFRPADHRGADEHRLRAAGTPLPGVEIRIVDPDGCAVPVGAAGEILIKSPAAMIGYWRCDATGPPDAGTWIATGDVGYLDEDGFVYVCDRLKDMIISAGENIYSAEIEHALRHHPDVADAAVIGIPDRLRGEAPLALVVRKAGSSVRAADLVRHTRTQLAAFKVPTSIEFVTDLPRNASGKVLKATLRDWHASRIGVQPAFGRSLADV